MYECKVKTKHELFQQIFEAARHIKGAVVLHNVTLNIIEWVRMCIQANGGDFEYLLNWTVQYFFQTLLRTELYGIFPVNK